MKIEAEQEFIKKHAEVEELLSELKAKQDAFYGVHPDEVNWCHVGDLNRIKAELEEITDRLYERGEYAE